MSDDYLLIKGICRKIDNFSAPTAIQETIRMCKIKKLSNTLVDSVDVSFHTRRGLIPAYEQMKYKKRFS